MIRVVFDFLLNQVEVVGDDPINPDKHHLIHAGNVVDIPRVDLLVLALGLLDEGVVERGLLHGVGVGPRLREGQVVRHDIADKEVGMFLLQPVHDGVAQRVHLFMIGENPAAELPIETFWQVLGIGSARFNFDQQFLVVFNRGIEVVIETRDLGLLAILRDGDGGQLLERHL
jgi:hypothetical protein